MGDNGAKCAILWKRVEKQKTRRHRCKGHIYHLKSVCPFRPLNQTMNCTVSARLIPKSVSVPLCWKRVLFCDIVKLSFNIDHYRQQRWFKQGRPWWCVTAMRHTKKYFFDLLPVKIYWWIKNIHDSLFENLYRVRYFASAESQNGKITTYLQHILVWWWNRSWRRVASADNWIRNGGKKKHRTVWVA